jgi:hypothetical protein
MIRAMLTPPNAGPCQLGVGSLIISSIETWEVVAVVMAADEVVDRRGVAKQTKVGQSQPLRVADVKMFLPTWMFRRTILKKS